MKVLTWISGIFCSFAVIMVLLYYAIIIPAFDLDFYNKEYDKYCIAESIGMEKSDLLIVTSHMLDYLKDVNYDLNIETIVAGEKRNFFNQKEIDHMVDVKELFLVGRNLKNSVLFTVVLFIITAYLKKDAVLRFQAKVNLMVVAVLTLILIIMGLFIYFDFDSAFNTFHGLFFSNDLWLLDPSTDLLINMVPLQFFIDITKKIATVFSLFLMVYTALSVLYLYLRGKTYFIHKIGR